MSDSRIVAVDHVEMQGPRDCAAELTWFYAQLLEFDPVDERLSETGPALRFRSKDLEVRYRLLSDPVLEPVDHRATFLVRSLRAARKLLESAGIRYELISGTSFTDRRLSLLDPAGNRVALRQMWRWVT